jgi:hypothetical protein
MTWFAFGALWLALILVLIGAMTVMAYVRDGLTYVAQIFKRVKTLEAAHHTTQHALLFARRKIEALTLRVNALERKNLEIDYAELALKDLTQRILDDFDALGTDEEDEDTPARIH